MKKSASSLLAILALCAAAASARAHSAAEEMAESAGHFLAALTPDQKAKAVFEFKSDERSNWHYIPKARKGLPFKEMTPAQHKLAHALLASGMSLRGYVKAATIMSLEQVLHELEAGGGSFSRDPELYYFSVFGQPGGNEPWGWRVEGHHLSLNFTIADGHEVAVTPSFFGANPAEVREGPRKGLRVLAEEEDLARELVKSLDAAQKKSAIVDTTAPREIITGAARRVEPLEQSGVAAAQLGGGQKQRLIELVKVYVNRCRLEVAEEDLNKIEKAGWDKVHFAWAGGLERGEGHYYRVQGPTFLLEYDDTQNNANHIHAVWRDFEGDFGEDILRRHYQETPHAR